MDWIEALHTDDDSPRANHLLRIAFALAFGLLTHVTFVVAVGVMIVALYTGMRTGIGGLHAWKALVANAALIVQFPVFHSFFLTPRGRKILAAIAPGNVGRDMVPTTFAFVAGFQTLVTFLFWSPSGVTIHEATGATLWVFRMLYVASLLFLTKAMVDARLGVQTGYIGWTSVLRGKRPNFGDFPTHGLFRVCRQPVYLGFALTLWTAPVHTLDGVVLAVLWTIYCVAAPALKEVRYLGWYGESYAKYRAKVPYIVPRIRV